MNKIAKRAVSSLVFVAGLVIGLQYFETIQLIAVILIALGVNITMQKV